MDEDYKYERKPNYSARNPHPVQGLIGWIIVIAIIASIMIGFCVWANNPSSQGVHKFEQETGWQPPDCDCQENP